jgi:phosphoenolpyruvate---glycerone phosphotransferase subunit DhaL
MNTTEVINAQSVIDSVNRVCDALLSQQDDILSLDQAMGDGDLGITVSKIGIALKKYVQSAPLEDVGKLLVAVGMETNKAGSSTMGTLLASALMRVGREIMGKSQLMPVDLANMLVVAGKAMQDRGKANLGDKTVLDVIIPAGEAFQEAINQGKSLEEAGQLMVRAAENGRDQVTPLKSRIGRASWIGDRTAGLVDPGCETMVIILRAIVNQ